MVYADLSRRRETQRRLYNRKMGVSLPGNGESRDSSLPRFVPEDGVGDRIGVFQSNRIRQRTATAENFLHRHWRPIVYATGTLAVLFTVYLFRYRIQEAVQDARDFFSSSNSKPQQPAKSPMDRLLDYADDVMRSSASSPDVPGS